MSPKYSRSIPEVYPKYIRGVAEVQPNNMADVRPTYSQSVYCKCTSSLAIGALVEMRPKYISKVHLKHSRSVTAVYPKCTLSINEVARRLAAAMLPPHRSLLLCRSRLAAAVHACMPFLPYCSCGALASLLLCRSCVAAAVPLSPRCCRTAPAWLLLHVALSQRSCCGTLNRTAAAQAVVLSHHYCCAALA